MGQTPPLKRQTTGSGPGSAASSRKGSLADVSGMYDDGASPIHTPGGGGGGGGSDDDDNDDQDDEDAGVRGGGARGKKSGSKKKGGAAGKRAAAAAAAYGQDDEDGEEDDDEDDGVEYGTSAANDAANDAAMQREQERLRELMKNFDESQMSRYEAFRRANVTRGSVKKLANAVLGQSIPAPVAVALSGLSKVFVGELAEMAKEVQHHENRKAYYELRDRMQKELDKKNGVKTASATTTSASTASTSDLSSLIPGTDPMFPFPVSIAPSSSSTSMGAPLLAGLTSPTFPFLQSTSLPGLLPGTSMDDSLFGPAPGAGLLASSTSGTASLAGHAASTATLNDTNPNNLVYPPTDDAAAEAAIELLDRQPLRPHHLREAWRLYRAEQGSVPAAHWRRQGGEGDGRMFR